LSTPHARRTDSSLFADDRFRDANDAEVFRDLGQIVLHGGLLCCFLEAVSAPQATQAVD
jgi:hypothetical protein